MRRAAGRAVELRDVTRRYAAGADGTQDAVRGVSLVVEPGSTVALTGVSGSGKSTLLHLVGGMDRPSSGSVVVDGEDLAGFRGRDLAEYRRSVGFVFQRFHLLPALTVRDNVLAPLLPVRGWRARRGQVDALIEAVGLGGRENALPSQLSGGQQQRVAIARALVNEPRLLLADEPTGNLDSRTGEDVLALLLEIQQRSRMTVLMATHDLQVATRCDRLVRLRDGRVVEDTVLAPPERDLLVDVSRLRP